MRTHRLLFTALLFGTSLLAIAQQPTATRLTTRRHFTVVEPNGASHRMTQLSFAGDVEGAVTLWQDAGGRRYILKFSDHHVEKTVSVSMAVVGSKQYVRATVAAAVRDDRNAPMTITTAAFQGTAGGQAWDSEDSAELRTKLRASLPADFDRALQDVGRLAAGTGSLAGGTVCKVLTSLISGDDSCAPLEDVVILSERVDCAFDAQFGYPCRSAAKN